jgi:hypothetical protein
MTNTESVKQTGESNASRVNQTAAKIVASALCKFTVDAQLPAIFPHNNRHAAQRVLRELAEAGYTISRR